MPRPAAPVPTPTWVTHEGLAQRARLAEAHRAAAEGPPRSKPVLALTNPAPIDKGLIGYPRPALILRNDDPINLDSRTLLPDVEY